MQRKVLRKIRLLNVVVKTMERTRHTETYQGQERERERNGERKGGRGMAVAIEAGANAPGGTLNGENAAMEVLGEVLGNKVSP